MKSTAGLQAELESSAAIAVELWCQIGPRRPWGKRREKKKAVVF